MAKDPALLFYTSDFLTGTLTFSNEETGMYIRLLCLQHQKGFLCEEDMIFICKTHNNKVFSKFVKDGEKFYNIRLKEEADRRKNYSESRSRNKLGKKKTGKKNRKSYVKHMETETETVNEIISYLNEKTKSNYSFKGKNTLSHINARISEGRTLEDFKKVIDVKSKEWLNDAKMQVYLRPDTLFGSKMESYLNQVKEPVKKDKLIVKDTSVEKMFPEANQ